MGYLWQKLNLILQTKAGPRLEMKGMFYGTCVTAELSKIIFYVGNFSQLALLSLE